MKLFDTHAHLQMKSFEGTKWWYKQTTDELIEKALMNSVTKILDVRCDRDDILSLPHDFRDDLIYSIGLHPNEAVNGFDDEYKNKFIQIAKLECVKAIGEIGLDLHYETPLQPQLESLKWHLDVANKLKLPVILHIRSAYNEFIDFIEENPEKFLNNKFVLHCFAGNAEHAAYFENKGFYLGIGGTVTFKNNDELKDIVKGYKKELIVLETDCPFLAPTPHRGKINSPANISIINEFVADLWNLTSEETADITYSNSITFFSI